MSDNNKIEKRLDQIVKLLSLLVTKEYEAKIDKIDVLDLMGFGTDDMADLLGITRDEASKIRYSARKKREKEKVSSNE